MNGNGRMSPLLAAAIKAREIEQGNDREERCWKPRCRICGKQVRGDEEETEAHEQCVARAKTYGMQLQLGVQRRT